MDLWCVVSRLCFLCEIVCADAKYPKEFFIQILSIVILLDVLCCIAKAWILTLIL